MKTLKRALTCALVLSLVMAPVIGANASSTMGSTTTTESSEGTKATEKTVAAIPETSSVGTVKTTVSGVYLASSVGGTAIATPMADLASNYGLTKGEKPYAKFANLDAKKSPLAKACIDQLAAANGAEVGPMINIELGKMNAGKYSLLPSDGADIKLTIGIPGNFISDEKSYALATVRSQGATATYEDLDSNPKTITVNIKGGACAAAIIRK